jgi:hybrid cluster-associated redox disulfide protein
MLTKETIIADILDMDYAPDIIPLFKAIGMHCLGCAAASNETIEEACMVHGVDPEEFLDAVNSVISEVSAR